MRNVFRSTRLIYGIPFHTIRYWQDQGRYLATRYGNDLVQRGLMQTLRSNSSARNIGHAVIQASAVLPPAAVRAAMRTAFLPPKDQQ